MTTVPRHPAPVRLRESAVRRIHDLSMATTAGSRTANRRLGWLTISVLSVVLLTGCTTDNHDLPTLGGHRAPTLSALEAVAKEYYDCMRESELPVELSTNGQGELAIVNFSGEHTVLARNADGSGMAMSTGKDDPAFNKQMEEFFASSSKEPALIIDGVDHSAVYAQCLKQSGYDEQAAWGPAMMPDQEYLAKLVEANNRWTSCAREHGWPSLKDSAMPTGPNDWPMVWLPGTISEDQLRALLTACPNFDPSQQEKMDAWYRDNPMASGYPDGWLPDPNINFEIADPNKADPHLEKLYNILYEQSSAYYEKMNEDATVAPR